MKPNHLVMPTGRLHSVKRTPAVARIREELEAARLSLRSKGKSPSTATALEPAHKATRRLSVYTRDIIKTADSPAIFGPDETAGNLQAA